jgi:hypothetical protein
MALVKINHTPATTISLRVPIDLKNEMTALRKLADKHDVDLTATLVERVASALKDIRDEIESLDKRPHTNGSTVNRSGNELPS